MSHHCLSHRARLATASLAAFFGLVGTTWQAKADITWTGLGATGSWFDRTNWAPSVVPGPADTVVINSGVVIVPDGLVLSNVTLNAGNLSGNFSISHTLNWSAGALGGGVTVTSSGVVNLLGNTGGASWPLVGVLTNQGRINWTAGSFDGWLFQNGRLENQAGGLLDMQVDGQIYSSGTTGLVNNAGTIRKSAGTNSATMSVPFNNTGLVDVQSGTFNLPMDFTSSGQFSVATNTAITLTGGTAHLLPGHQFQGAGYYGVSNGEVTIDGALSWPNFRLSGGNLTISNQLSGVLQWTAGALSGSLTVTSSGVVNLLGNTGGASWPLLGALINQGRINWTAGSFDGWLIQNGRLDNQAGGLLDMQVDGQIYSSGGTGLVNNAGTIRKSAGTNAATLSEPFNNTGLIDVQSGTFNLPMDFTSSGQFSVATNTAITLTGGTAHLLPGHQFQGAGYYGVPNGEVTIDGALSWPNFRLSGGNLTISNQLSGVLQWTAGALSGSLTVTSSGVVNLLGNTGGASWPLLGALINQGRINWTAGSFDGWLIQNGRLDNRAGGLLDMQVDGQIYSSGGTGLVNNAGTIRKSAGTNAATLSEPFNNTGLIDVQSGTFNLPMDFTSSGQFAAAANAAVTLTGGTAHLLPGHQFQGAGYYGVPNGEVTIDGALSWPNFRLSGGNLTISNQLSGVLQWTAGALSGSLTVTSSGVINLLGNTGGASWPLLGVLANQGRINWTAGSFNGWLIQNGRLDNQAGGLLDMQVDGQIYSSGGTGLVNNAGTFRKSAGTATAVMNVPFNNSGMVDVESGAVEFAGVYSQTGGQFNVGLGGPTIYGRIIFDAPVQLAGKLSAVLVNSFQPGIGDSFDVVSYPSATGALSGITVPPLTPPGQWITTNGPTKVTLTVSAGLARMNVGFSAGQFTLSWSSLADPAYAVEYATNLTPPVVWLPLTNAVTLNGDQRGVTVPTTNGLMFFRLLK